MVFSQKGYKTKKENNKGYLLVLNQLDFAKNFSKRTKLGVKQLEIQDPTLWALNFTKNIFSELIF